ncbi:unnamed protein product [Chrysoparadoxa australica]
MWLPRVLLLGLLSQTQAFAPPTMLSSRHGPAIFARLSRRQAATSLRMVSAAGQGQGQKQQPQQKKKKEKKPDSIYKSTVILPQTDFQQRANAINREPELQQFWADEKVYEELVESNSGSKFILHDGPPYANGDLHIGHALNKVLKDFINRYQLQRGRKARYVPGWDCHGLPIELKVLQTMKSKERQGMTPLDLRKKAAAFAQETVAKQRESFKRYGIWGDWEAPYMTLQPEYEAAQIGVFGKMFDEGHIYRGRKPVNWSPSSRTALAEAELEYPEGHTSTSMYAAFTVTEPSDALKEAANGSEVAVTVWTTTPWTMPANLAVAVNVDLEYSLVSHPSQSRMLVIAKELLGTMEGKLGLPEGEHFTIISTLKGGDLVGSKYQHPICDRVSEVVAGGDYITTEAGTGLVHTAPGHGQEDYLTGQKYGLPLLSPVDDAGRFTSEAGERFKGMDVLKEGNVEVLDAMKEAGALLLAEAYAHKYPYDWRTKKPTIFRATDQWFASVDGFRDKAMAAIDEVTWIPEIGKNRIGGMVKGRNDWCISRQRNWGVPIPVFYHRETGEPLISHESIAHIQALVAKKGTDAWWELDESELLPPTHQSQAADWVKGTDTMDVWFDSGSSWAAGVARLRGELEYPVELYLEGSDQHRGWFQSSLLTSVATNGVAPYKKVLTHGFVLDEKGYKMSKSLGNVINPLEVIEGGNNKKQKPAYGADVLRLWVSTVDYSSDVCVGDNILKQVFETYRKLRNTARYLTGNLFDFDPATHTVAYDDLASLDKWVLGKLSETMEEVTEAYDSFQFSRASQAILRFSTSELSNFYLDVAKDRLYISGADDWRRRSCQTVLQVLLGSLCKSIAAILPHLAEDIWQNLPYDAPYKSVFQAGWVEEAAYPPYEAEMWDKARQLRADVNKALEAARDQKVLGASLEAQVYIHCPDAETRAMFEGMKGDDTLSSPPESTNAVDDLRFVLMVSSVEFVDSAEEVVAAAGEEFSLVKGTESGCAVGISKASKTKCERCWYNCESVGKHEQHPTLCTRCTSIVEAQGFQPPAL